MAERKEYIVTLFKDKNKWGFSLSPVKRLSTAERRFNEALKSGKYVWFILEIMKVCKVKKIHIQCYPGRKHYTCKVGDYTFIFMGADC